MKVVILAGGFGTRLSEETGTIPKPMIEIGGRPLLWHIMKIFSTQGFNEFTVALGYKAEVIKQYFLQYRHLHADLRIDLEQGRVNSHNDDSENWTVELIDTGRATLTGGRVKRLKRYLDGTFFLTYGDGLSNVDLNRLLEFHRSHGKLATVTAVSPPQRFGLMELDGDRVLSFNEKLGKAPDVINGGFFVLEPQVIDYIAGDQISWEREPLENLVRDGQLMAYRHDDYWQCVDTLHELRTLRDDWESGNAGWKIWE